MKRKFTWGWCIVGWCILTMIFGVGMNGKMVKLDFISRMSVKCFRRKTIKFLILFKFYSRFSFDIWYINDGDILVRNILFNSEYGLSPYFVICNSYRTRLQQFSIRHFRRNEIFITNTCSWYTIFFVCRFMHFMIINFTYLQCKINLNAFFTTNINNI